MEAVSRDSSIVQDFHFGYLRDSQTGNWNETITTTKDYPAIIVTPPTADKLRGADNIFPESSLVSMTISIVSTGYYQPDGRPNPNKTYESYVGELRQTLFQILRRINEWHSVLTFDTSSGTNSDNNFSEKLFIYTLPFQAIIDTTTYCDPLLMRGIVTNADLDALAATYTSPSELLSDQQKAIFNAL